MRTGVTVGRIVHWQSHGCTAGAFEVPPTAMAAIVTEVLGDDVVGLAVFTPTSLFFHQAFYSEDPQPGYWSWPPKARTF